MKKELFRPLSYNEIRSVRDTGRTTGRLLITLGKAIADPTNRWIEFTDHFPMNSQSVKVYRNAIANMASLLELDIETKIDKDRLFVKSCHDKTIIPE